MCPVSSDVDRSLRRMVWIVTGFVSDVAGPFSELNKPVLHHWASITNLT